MFSFFKNHLEKDLTKLGFSQLLKGYKLKLKTKEWTKQEYNDALKKMHTQHKNKLDNLGNINVSTRQTFDVDDSVVPLNLQNIQQEYIDYDYMYSSLLYELNSNNRIHTKAVYELNKLLQDEYPDTIILKEDAERVKNLSLKQLVHEATLPFTIENKDYLKAVFNELKNRS